VPYAAPTRNPQGPTLGTFPRAVKNAPAARSQLVPGRNLAGRGVAAACNARLHPVFVRSLRLFLHYFFVHVRRSKRGLRDAAYSWAKQRKSARNEIQGIIACLRWRSIIA
jgi:hypothetical protein